MKSDDVEELKEAFDDHLNLKDVKTNDMNQIMSLDMGKILKRNSRRGLTGL